jgi:hypothetical protein
MGLDRSLVIGLLTVMIAADDFGVCSVLALAYGANSVGA